MMSGERRRHRPALVDGSSLHSLIARPHARRSLFIALVSELVVAPVVALVVVLFVRRARRLRAMGCVQGERLVRPRRQAIVDGGVKSEYCSSVGGEGGSGAEEANGRWG